MKLAHERTGASPSMFCSSTKRRSRSATMRSTVGRSSASYISTATSAAVCEKALRLYGSTAFETSRASSGAARR